MRRRTSKKEKRNDQEVITWRTYNYKVSQIRSHNKIEQNVSRSVKHIRTVKDLISKLVVNETNQVLYDHYFTSSLFFGRECLV